MADAGSGAQVKVWVLVPGGAMGGIPDGAEILYGQFLVGGRGEERTQESSSASSADTSCWSCGDTVSTKRKNS